MRIFATILQVIDCIWFLACLVGLPYLIWTSDNVLWSKIFFHILSWMLCFAAYMHYKAVESMRDF